MEEIIRIDRELFCFLNGLNAAWLDPVVFWMTKTVVWLPLFALLFWLVYRKYGLRKTLWILAFIAVIIVIGDQLANLVKMAVQRLRPTYDPDICPVHIVNGYKGGQFGFYSSHASNTFAIAVFLWIILYRYYRWIPALVLTWALVHSYTRIYLGVHFPADLLTGMLAGSILGLIFGLAFRWMDRKVSD